MNERETHAGFTIVISQDDHTDSPRDWDNLGTMACYHRKYDLGDLEPVQWLRSSDYHSFEEMQAAVEQRVGACLFLPLYLYDHSGLTMNTTGFSCPWDSGQVGITWVSLEKVRQEYSVKRVSQKTRAKALEVLRSEVETYDQYLRGDVWRFRIEDEEGDDIDSCGGFFGREYCLQEARQAADWQARERGNVECETCKREEVA